VVDEEGEEGNGGKSIIKEERRADKEVG